MTCSSGVSMDHVIEFCGSMGWSLGEPDGDSEGDTNRSDVAGWSSDATI